MTPRTLHEDNLCQQNCTGGGSSNYYTLLKNATAAASGQSAQLITSRTVIYQSTYASSNITCAQSGQQATTYDTTVFTAPGTYQIGNLPAFTLSSANGVSKSVLFDGTILISDGTNITVSYPNGQSTTVALSSFQIAIARNGFHSDISKACAIDLLGIGAASIGILAACALSGPAAAVIISTACAYFGYGVAIWSAIHDCF